MTRIGPLPWQCTESLSDWWFQRVFDFTWRHCVIRQEVRVNSRFVSKGIWSLWWFGYYGTGEIYNFEKCTRSLIHRLVYRSKDKQNQRIFDKNIKNYVYVHPWLPCSDSTCTCGAKICESVMGTLGSSTWQFSLYLKHYAEKYVAAEASRLNIHLLQTHCFQLFRYLWTVRCPSF